MGLDTARLRVRVRVRFRVRVRVRDRYLVLIRFILWLGNLSPFGWSHSDDHIILETQIFRLNWVFKKTFMLWVI